MMNGLLSSHKEPPLQESCTIGSFYVGPFDKSYLCDSFLHSSLQCDTSMHAIDYEFDIHSWQQIATKERYRYQFIACYYHRFALLDRAKNAKTLML